MTVDAEDIREARDLIVGAQRQGKRLDEAARSMRKFASVDWLPAIDAALEELRAEAKKNRVLEIPPGVNDEYSLEEERLANWYLGPQAGDKLWGQLAPALRAKFPDEDYASLDAASTKVVANLADPHVERLTKRGLVLGYVQP